MPQTTRPQTVADQLLLDSILIQLGLHRFQEGTVRSILAVLLSSQGDLERQIRISVERRRASTPTGVRMRLIERELRSVIRETYKALEDELALAQLPGLATRMAAVHAQSFERALPFSFSLTRPDPLLLEAIATKNPFEGRLLSGHVDTLEAAMKAALLREIQVGLTLGETTGQIITRVVGTEAAGGADGALNLSRHQAAAVTRTAVQHVHAEARDQLYLDNQDVIKAVMGGVTLDERTCRICGPRDGLVWDLPEYKPVGHDLPWLAGAGRWHMQCVPGDTIVRAGSLQAVTKRWHEGELVVIVTAMGNELSCTPNHPILTDQGWRAAGELVRGDDVVRDVGVEWTGTDYGKSDQPPTRIENLANAFFRLSEVSSEAALTLVEDFHGDGTVGSQVTIVGYFEERDLRYVGEQLLRPHRAPPLPPNGRLALHLLDGGAGLVELDRVVEVRRVNFSGFVYNLSTADGAFTAGGVITHNCRCTSIPVLSDLDDFEDAGGDVSALTKGERAAVGGPVSSQVDYEEWLRTVATREERVRALGKGRADWWEARPETSLEDAWKRRFGGLPVAAATLDEAFPIDLKPRVPVFEDSARDRERVTIDEFEKAIREAPSSKATQRIDDEFDAARSRIGEIDSESQELELALEALSPGSFPLRRLDPDFHEKIVALDTAGEVRLSITGFKDGVAEFEVHPALLTAEAVGERLQEKAKLLNRARINRRTLQAKLATARAADQRRAMLKLMNPGSRPVSDVLGFDVPKSHETKVQAAAKFVFGMWGGEVPKTLRVLLSNENYSFHSTGFTYLTKGAGRRVAVHELGHVLEYIFPGIHEKARAYWEKRTGGEESIDLGYNRGMTEVSKFDKWLHKYMGKIYDNNSELLSMGLEYLWAEPELLLDQDRDFLEWLLGVLQP